MDKQIIIWLLSVVIFPHELLPLSTGSAKLYLFLSLVSCLSHRSLTQVACITCADHQLCRRGQCGSCHFCHQVPCPLLTWTPWTAITAPRGWSHCFFSLISLTHFLPASPPPYFSLTSLLPIFLHLSCPRRLYSWLSLL